MHKCIVHAACTSPPRSVRRAQVWQNDCWAGLAGATCHAVPSACPLHTCPPLVHASHLFAAAAHRSPPYGTSCTPSSHGATLWPVPPALNPSNHSLKRQAHAAAGQGACLLPPLLLFCGPLTAACARASCTLSCLGSRLVCTARHALELAQAAAQAAQPPTGTSAAPTLCRLLRRRTQSGKPTAPAWCSSLVSTRCVPHWVGLPCEMQPTVEDL